MDLRLWPISCVSIMWVKLSLFVGVALIVGNSHAFVRREVTTQANVLESFQKNMDQLRHCLDQTLAKAVGDVNENQLKPVFNVLGDSINRFSKAFEDLAGTTKKPDPDFDI